MSHRPALTPNFSARPSAVTAQTFIKIVRICGSVMTFSHPCGKRIFFAVRAATTAPPAPTSVEKAGRFLAKTSPIFPRANISIFSISDAETADFGDATNLRVIFTAPMGRLVKDFALPFLPKTISRLPPPKSKYAVGS